MSEQKAKNMIWGIVGALLGGAIVGGLNHLKVEASTIATQQSVKVAIDDLLNDEGRSDDLAALVAEKMNADSVDRISEAESRITELTQRVGSVQWVNDDQFRTGNVNEDGSPHKLSLKSFVALFAPHVAGQDAHWRGIEILSSTR